MFGGGGGSEKTAVAAPATSASPVTTATEPTGACAWEIKQFLKCADEQSDLSLCKDVCEAMRQCKVAHSKYFIAYL